MFPFDFMIFSTLVLNIVFKINLAISFIRKKLAGMHWLGYNDIVFSLNEAKTRIFQPTVNFENFEIHLAKLKVPVCLHVHNNV